MSEIKITSEGSRGPRGHEGPRGPTGPAGATETGAIGPTGPTGAGVPLAVGLFSPNGGGSSVAIISQSGEFASAQYLGAGNYLIRLNAIAGLTAGNQIIPVGVVGANGSGSPFTIDLVAAFAGVGTIQVSLWDNSNTPVDEEFYLHVALLGI